MITCDTPAYEGDRSLVQFSLKLRWLEAGGAGLLAQAPGRLPRQPSGTRYSRGLNEFHELGVQLTVGLIEPVLQSLPRLLRANDFAQRVGLGLLGLP
ncbi:hypothetical protein N864_16630 [Intrasporangium chromatireducens Q5-1]|uniref:Uncharacterized protein n=1 Tax=Intrasporangium chromatireducens Q5-1 TaxID=584657 RepID=W9GD81_9MICO|nr:hypothetical protein N864_16630 [Intrasporangium chromatireducens Q5-1]